MFWVLIHCSTYNIEPIDLSNDKKSKDRNWVKVPLTISKSLLLIFVHYYYICCIGVALLTIEMQFVYNLKTQKYKM